MKPLKAPAGPHRCGNIRRSRRDPFRHDAYARHRHSVGGARSRYRLAQHGKRPLFRASGAHLRSRGLSPPRAVGASTCASSDAARRGGDLGASLCNRRHWLHDAPRLFRRHHVQLPSGRNDQLLRRDHHDRRDRQSREPKRRAARDRLLAGDGHLHAARGDAACQFSILVLGHFGLSVYRRNFGFPHDKISAWPS